MSVEELDGTSPGEGRRIIYAHSDGKVYSMGIISFVVFQTARALRRSGLLEEEITAELVAEHTPGCAQALSEDGWFTPDEYVAAWAAEEASDIDEEFRDLIE